MDFAQSIFSTSEYDKEISGFTGILTLLPRKGARLKTDVEIAQAAKLRPIKDIAADLGLSDEEFSPYGHTKAKIELNVCGKESNKPPAKLVLVTAITPTPSGEGKTTVNIGLSMGLNRIGKEAICTLREPSLGPCFGMKGGAAGGGYSQVLPMEDINLHFTGDIHAVTSAHNLLAALIDNSIYQGNPLGIDPKRISWPRVMDISDRALRSVIVGLGKRTDGVTHASSFDITVASEIMAALCLATNLKDLKNRIGQIVVGLTYDGSPVTANDLQATGALTLLLKDAIKPNLVQTIEGTPAIIHGGPFANIAHGCNSIIALKTAAKLSEYVVTEAGFGADLGAQKFLDIVTPKLGQTPDAVVVVASVQALAHHGGDQSRGRLEAMSGGMPNLIQHVKNLTNRNLKVVVAINRFPNDTAEELDRLEEICRNLGIEAVIFEGFTNGGEGSEALAKAVVRACERPSEPLIELSHPYSGIKEKIETIVTQVYHGAGVVYSPVAQRKITRLHERGYGQLPVCISKTQYSFSDDPKLIGTPRGFKINVRDVIVNAGAGFIVVLTGNTLRMPGLPKVPAAVGMDIFEDGTITGLS